MWWYATVLCYIYKSLNKFIPWHCLLRHSVPNIPEWEGLMNQRSPLGIEPSSCTESIQLPFGGRHNGLTLIAGSWELKKGSGRWPRKGRWPQGSQFFCLTSFAGLRPLLLCSWINRLGGISVAVSDGPHLPMAQRVCTIWDFLAECQSGALHKHIPGTLWLALIPKKGKSMKLGF